MPERMLGKGSTPAVPAGGSASWYSSFGYQYGIFFRKLGNDFLQDPAIPLLGIYPQDVQSYYKDMCSAVFIGALFVIAITWKQPKCSYTEEGKHGTLT